MPDIRKVQLWKNVKHEHIGTHCATTNFADNVYMGNKRRVMRYDVRRARAVNAIDQFTGLSTHSYVAGASDGQTQAG